MIAVNISRESTVPREKFFPRDCLRSGELHPRLTFQPNCRVSSPQAVIVSGSLATVLQMTEHAKGVILSSRWSQCLDCNEPLLQQKRTATSSSTTFFYVLEPITSNILFS